MAPVLRVDTAGQQGVKQRRIAGPGVGLGVTSADAQSVSTSDTGTSPVPSNGSRESDTNLSTCTRAVPRSCGAIDSE
ncbi:hypothetical protein [Haloechinothrix salitolerans]|uniref:Uncharacterized protein n=1 Tax=Haloechinothrix salitolerans TaxID=926830 RepID=A0ABW2C4F3_9PSEU